MEQVVCINDKPMNGHTFWPGDPLVKGIVYTLIGMASKDTLGTRGYIVQGLCSGSFSSNGEQFGYDQKHFGPIRRTSIEIFRSIDKDIFSKDKVDA